MDKYNDFIKRGKLLKFLSIFMFPVAFLSKIIPRKKGLYLYASMNGYGVVDNSKYLYLEKKGTTNVFLVKNKKILENRLGDGTFPLYTYSLRGVILQLIAERVYFTHGIYDFIPVLILGAEKHNLWHGVPLKCIGPIHDWGNNKRFVFKLKLLFYRLFSYTYYMTCDFVYCPFEDRIDDYKEYFLVSMPVILIEKQYRNRVKKSKKNNTILYAPTHRTLHFKDFNYNEYLIKIGFFSKKLNSLLKDKGVELMLRPHPIDLEAMSNTNVFDTYKLDSSVDLYESLDSHLFIITDYSSIYFDCIERDLTCLIVSADFETYVREVGIESDFLTTLSRDKVTTLIQAVNNYSSNTV